MGHTRASVWPVTPNAVENRQGAFQAWPLDRLQRPYGGGCAHTTLRHAGSYGRPGRYWFHSVTVSVRPATWHARSSQ